MPHPLKAPLKTRRHCKGNGTRNAYWEISSRFLSFFDVDGTGVWRNDMSLFPATNQERPYEQLLHYPGMLLFIP